MTTLDLTIVKGKTAFYDIAVTTTDANGTSIACDLTGAGVTFTVKPSLYTANADFQKEAGDGITVLDAANGSLRLQLDATDTEDYDNRDELYCDLNVSFPGVAVYTAASGTLTFHTNAPVNLANS